MQLEAFYNKLDSNDKSKYFPFFDTDKTIIDKIDSGYKLTLSDYTQVEINEVSYTILTLCIGSLSIEQIIEEMVKIYDAPENVIERDVIKILYSFWGSTVISWRDDKNYYSDLYEEEVNGFVFRVPMMKELLKLIENTKADLVFDSRYNPDIKFTSAYIEKEMHIKEMRSFECEKDGKTLIHYSLVPNMSYLNGKEEIISFNIDAIYVDSEEKDNVNKIQNTLFEWSLTWFDNLEKGENSVLHIKSPDTGDDSALSILSFVKVENCGSEKGFYERAV